MKEADTNKRVSASFYFTPTDSNKREGENDRKQRAVYRRTTKKGSGTNRDTLKGWVAKSIAVVLSYNTIANQQADSKESVQGSSYLHQRREGVGITFVPHPYGKTCRAAHLDSSGLAKRRNAWRGFAEPQPYAKKRRQKLTKEPTDDEGQSSRLVGRDG